MNHSFSPKALKTNECAVCSRTLMDHSSFAQCEVCSNKGKCNIFMTILMCESCEVKEKELQSHNKETEEDRVNSYKSITNSAGYFNARITPIVELKTIYELNGQSFTDFHAKIKEQIEHFSKVLFEQSIESKPDEISNLLIEFRAEVRSKLKEHDINYVPPTKAPKIARPKSALEKAAINLMKIKNISLDEAKRILMKELGGL